MFGFHLNYGTFYLGHKQILPHIGVAWCGPPLRVVLGKPAGVFLLTSASILCPPHFQTGSSYLQPFLVKIHLLLPFSFHTSLTTGCHFCSGYSLYLRAGVYIVSIFAIRYLKVANIWKDVSNRFLCAYST